MFLYSKYIYAVLTVYFFKIFLNHGNIRFGSQIMLCPSISWIMYKSRTVLIASTLEQICNFRLTPFPVSTFISSRRVARSDNEKRRYKSTGKVAH